MNSRSYVKLWRDEAVFELIAANPLTYVLASIIALRSRWSDAFNVHGLKPGEAFLGDHENYGMTQRQYRTCKEQLSTWGFATFRTTNKGTIATLTDTRLFSVLNEPADKQNDRQPTNDRQTTDKRPTTNLKGIEGTTRVEGKDTGRAPAGLPVELPTGFPATEQAAKAACGMIGCPDDFILKVWNRAMGRGGRDSKDVPIRSFARHVAATWSDERDYQSRNPQHSQPGKQEPHKPTLQDFF